MLEKEIEAYLVKRVKEIGGRAYKFVSPGNAGVPDRIVLLPGGRTVFVELKAPGKTPTSLQMAQMGKIVRLGHAVWVLDDKAEVDHFISVFQTKGMIGS